jgi:hypothetical protein
MKHIKNVEKDFHVVLKISELLSEMTELLKVS